VRDFVDLRLGDYHWPAFNVADSALSVGIILLLLGSMRGGGKKGGPGEG
jgi:signal peptidase II